MYKRSRQIYSGLLDSGLSYLGLLMLAIGLMGCSTGAPLFDRVSLLNQCLPEDRNLSDVVSATIVPGTADTVEKVTIGQKLRELGARCQNQQLVDRSGQAIRFFNLDGCWGNPPSNVSELMQEQAEVLQNLKETYTVIEMTCNPTGIPYP